MFEEDVNDDDDQEEEEEGMRSIYVARMFRTLLARGRHSLILCKLIDEHGQVLERLSSNLIVQGNSFRCNCKNIKRGLHGALGGGRNCFY